MPDLGIVDINDPLGNHPLNKSRRFWFKALPGLYGGLTYYDLCKKYNLPLIGFGDPAVSGWRRTNRIGQYGYVEFDGVDDQAAGPIGPSLQNNYTLAVSVYIDSATLSHGCALKVGDTTQGVGIGIGNAASPGFEFEGNDLIVLLESVRWVTGKTAIGTGWHRLAVSAAANGTVTVYLDGVQVAASTGYGPNAPGSFNAYVGGYASTAGGGNYPRYFRGPVDNATLYTKVLSAAEVKEDCKLELIGFVDALNYVKRKPYLILSSVPDGSPAPVGISGGATWDVRNNVGSTYESSWYDLAPVGVAGAASFDVRAPVGLVGAASFDVRSSVGATYEATHDVRVSVGATYEATHDVHVSVGATCELIYDVYVSIGLSVSATWDVLPAPVPIELQPVGLTGSAAWDVRSAVGFGGDTSWNTSELANISGSAAWSVLAAVHVIGTVAWTDRIPVGWEGSAIWANMLPVGLTAGAAWGVRAPARIAANAPWSVRSVVGVTRVDSWRDRVLAGLERSASWSLRGLAGLVNGATWDVATVLAHWPVGIEGSLVWADRSRLGLGGLITWDDRQPRGLARSATYDIHKNSRIDGDIRFHVRSRMGTVGLASWRLRSLERITYTAIWNYKSLAGVAAVAGWDVRARVGMLRESGWSDRRPVGMSLSGAWQDRSRAGISGVGNWRTLARVGPNLRTYWNVRESIGVGVGAAWDLRGLVTLSGAVRFLTFRATPPAPIEYDPAAVAAFLESRHGSGPWGTYPDPGSVRVDHDYPAPDSMRALRGEDGIPGVSIRIYDKSDYENGFRDDPAAVRARSLTGPDGRWISSVYLIPGEYVILYRESERFPVADYLTVIGTVPGREPPGLTEVDINNPYYELDYLLSLGHGKGEWGPGSGLRGPSPVDHHYGGPDRYTLTRYGRGLGGVIIYIYTESDYNAGRTGSRYRIGHSRTNESGRWDWPVDLYPGRYVAMGWKEGLANTFIIEVT